MGVNGSHVTWCDCDTKKEDGPDPENTGTTKQNCYHLPPPSYNHNWTDLHYAASHGNVKKIYEIIDKSGTALLNKKDYYGKTALYWAAYKGHYVCMQALLKHGAHVTTQCKHGATPLHAVVSLYPDSARLLIQYGADVDCADKWGVTPMYLAASSGQIDAIRFLIIAGANLTYKNKNTGEVPRQLRAQPVFCEYLNRYTHSPPCLQWLARTAIRRRLGDHPIRKLKSLDLPKPIINYIALTDVDRFETQDSVS